MKKPKICILKTDGINCDMEMNYAFAQAGGDPQIIHINQLRQKQRNLSDFAALAIPGGFSYGDDIASGKVLATELTSYLSDQLREFVNRGKPILGICNGFQVLVRTGLLPNRSLGSQQATLAENEIGRFECRWVNLTVAQSVCKFINANDYQTQTIPMQTAHGEGRFFAHDTLIDQLRANKQIVFRYSAACGQAAKGYPENPNGALDNIAGICDPSGLILGMMPHPERSIAAFHPHRKQTQLASDAACLLFNNIVNYAKGL